MRRLQAPASPIGRTNLAGRPVRNSLLLSMPEPEFLLIRPHLEYLTLPHLRVLHEPNETLQSAYFLNSGLISLMIETREGKTVEVGIIGKEGMVGMKSAV